MCIVCNVGDSHPTAYRFLDDFRKSQEAMKAAADAMLAVSAVAVTAEDRKRYKAVHKRMVRQMREWSKIEQQREAQSPPAKVEG
ncbi:hypothetical protein [Sphingomonas sp. SAFR-052]|uniref:hypothetical protein n=1 Tax=Sphingomonas sp. SAFR-052 TaxID=3436867 RepID=UPI003F81B2C6